MNNNHKTKYIKLIILVAILHFIPTSCITQKKDPIVPGVTVQKFTEDGIEKYRIISIGQANQKYMESDNIIQRKRSSCDAAKLMLRSKIVEIRKNPRASELMATSEGTNTYEDGKFCKTIYSMNVEW